jgi:predicted ABC-type ATPase
MLCMLADLGSAAISPRYSVIFRQKWLTTGASFTFETVMSSSDKITLLQRARQLGYRCYLYYVCTSDPRINRARVAVRVKQGGHSVPIAKIAQRYQRSLAHLYDAIQACDRAYLFDNSGKTHRLVSEYNQGRLIRVAEDLPSWFIHHVLDRGK